VLLAVFVAYTAFGVLFQIFPPLLTAIAGQFHLSHGAAALVMVLFLVPILVMALPAGLLVDRYGVRRVGWLAFALLMLGAAMSVGAPTFALLLLGRVVSGCGGGLLVVDLLALVTQCIAVEQRGLALGIFAAGLPVGTGVAFDLLAPLSGWWGWRGEMGIALLLVLAALLVFARAVLWVAPGQGSSAQLREVLRSGQLWRLALVTMLGYTGILGFTTWAPATLVAAARVPSWLGAVIASVLLVVDIPFAPFWGAVSDHAGRRKPFILLSFTLYFIGSLLVPLAAQAGPWRVPALLIVVTEMGVGCAMFFPVALTMPAEAVAADQAGVAYGLFFLAQVAGMLVGPLIIGLVLDHGSAQMMFLTVSALTLAGLLASTRLQGR
jgi:MFS family permease